MTSTLQTPSQRPRGEETSGNTLFEHSRPRLGMNGLHYEILGEIFRLSLSARLQIVQDEVYQFMLVCRNFRGACLSTPRLWTGVAFNLLHGTKAEEQKAIRRCKMCWDYQKPKNGLPTLTRPARLWNYLASLPRLSTIRLRSREIVSIFEWFYCSWNPLTDLTIDASKQSITAPPPRNVFAEYGDVASATADDMLTKWKSNAVGEGMGLGNLTTLTLHAYISTYFLLSVLEETPALESLDVDLNPNGCRSHLVLNEGVRWKTGQSDKVISLLRLRELKIANVTQKEEVLECLRVPHCQRLRVQDMNSHFLPLLIQCLEGSGVTLKQLELRFINVINYHLLRFLRNFPCIHALTLHRLELVNGSFLDDLALDGNHQVLHRLKSLDIAGNWKQFDTTALVRFIKSKGVTFRARALKGEDDAVDPDGSLEWALFQDSLYPELFVRYEAHGASAKLLRTVKVNKQNTWEIDEAEE
ncbi:hypothetical protein NMY22_g19210 [Coprinellus aureogranulatus]|nr:hypothetical protein NMY22_g19210 [Coprinellus aureogranulatus]